MGHELTIGRGPRAWSRLSQVPATRMCLRALIFAGAVGVTWLVGSATATAHESTGHEAEAMRTVALTGVERLVENNTVMARQAGEPSCTPVSSASDVPSPIGTSVMTDVADVSGVAVVDDTVHSELAPSRSTEACDASDRGHGVSDDTWHADPVSQVLPLATRAQFGVLQGLADTDPDSSVELPGNARGEHRTAVGSSLQVTDSIVRNGITTAAPVSHTDGWSPDMADVTILDVDHVVATAVAPMLAPMMGPVTTVLGPLTDGLSATVLQPLLDGMTLALPQVSPPAAGKPTGQAHHTLASPVTPDVGRANSTTSTGDSVDEVQPTASVHQTGSTPGAESPVPTAPAPAPLPAVPGSGVSTGTETGSSGPVLIGGVVATIPASLDPRALEVSALHVTAYDASLRDLAGEPAVSPD